VDRADRRRQKADSEQDHRRLHEGERQEQRRGEQLGSDDQAAPVEAVAKPASDRS
jgi:hypothetical protein